MFLTKISESVLPNIDKTAQLLISKNYTNNPKDANKLALNISQFDPYDDKRMSPTIANWLINKKIQSANEHFYDIDQFKKLRIKLKKLRVPAQNVELKNKVNLLLRFDPTAAQQPYLIQQWNDEVGRIVDPNKNLSDTGLEKVAEHQEGGDNFILYKIATKQDLEVPIVKNLMSWCITKDYFGQYGGPPYYPIVQYKNNGQIVPFAMIIPKYFSRDPDQAVRNGCNTDRLSTKDTKRVRPLLQKVLKYEDYEHDYIKGIYGEKYTGDVSQLTAEKVYGIMKDYAIELGDWPEGEEVLKQDPLWAYYYARDIIGGRWPEAEPYIMKNPEYVYNYAKNVIGGRWKEAEPYIKQDPQFTYQYARDVIKGRFPEAELYIMKNPEYAYNYALEILKGRWKEAEPYIKQDPLLAYYYAKNVIGGRWKEAEPYIKQNQLFAYYYAKNVIGGRWKEAEPYIMKNPDYVYSYAKDVIKDRWKEAEPYIKQDRYSWNQYKKHLNINDE